MNNASLEYRLAYESQIPCEKKHRGYMPVPDYSAHSAVAESSAHACSWQNAPGQVLPAGAAILLEVMVAQADQGHNMPPACSPDWLSALRNLVRASLVTPSHLPVVAGVDHARDSTVTLLYQSATLIPGLYQLR